MRLLRSAAVLARWNKGSVERVVAPPLPLHVVAQQCLALALQEGAIGRQRWFRWLGQPFVLGDEAGSMVTTITDHLVAEGYLHDDGGLLSINLEGKTAFSYQHFLELLAVFASPPMLSVRYGRD